MGSTLVLFLVASNNRSNVDTQDLVVMVLSRLCWWGFVPTRGLVGFFLLQPFSYYTAPKLVSVLYFWTKIVLFFIPL